MVDALSVVMCNHRFKTKRCLLCVNVLSESVTDLFHYFGVVVNVTVLAFCFIHGESYRCLTF